MRHWQFVTTLPRSHERCPIQIFCPFWLLLRSCGGGGTDFILRDFHHWFQDRIGQLVDCLCMPIVIGNEQGVWPNREDDERGYRHITPPRPHCDPITVCNT